MKTYVIGSSGFIGQHLVNFLVSKGHTVREIHHNEPYTITSADYIFYLASYGNHYTQKDQYQTVKANILDYYDLIRNTQNVRYKGLIHFSTSSVILPIQTLYSDSKLVSEILSKRYARKHKKPIVSIRPYSVYGEGEADFRFIPTIISKLKSGKKLKLSKGMHDWIYIDDFLRGLYLVMKNILQCAGKAISIGTGKQHSNLEVVNILEQIAGKEVSISHAQKPLRSYDTTNWCADITILKHLGWESKTTLEKGLKKVYEHT